MVKLIDIMIVGTQKAGTTSLLRYLGQHPEIHTHMQNEMNYFMHEYEKDYQDIFLKYFPDNHGQILLAKHVYVMYCPETISRLLAHNPRMHLLLLLRNPVKRAYSAFWYARRMGWETAGTFAEALRLEESRLQEGWHKWSNCAYLFNGNYYPHVQRLFETVDRQRIHIFLTEDLKNDPSGVCRRIFEQLDVDRNFLPQIGVRHNTSTRARSELMARALLRILQQENPVKKMLKKVFPEHFLYSTRQFVREVNKREFMPPPMDPAQQTALVEHFKRPNEMLGELIDRDLSHWNHPQ